MAGNLKADTHWLLECVDPVKNHDKYYEAFTIAPASGKDDEWMCVLHWGRRGGKGQVQVHRGRQADVGAVAGTKFHDKLRGGYVTVTTSGKPTLSDQLMQQIENEGVPVGGWAKNGWADAVSTTGVLVPEKVLVDMSTFIQTLLASNEVTPEMVGQRSTFLEQMDSLRNSLQEVEATVELMDTVYAKRLS